MHETANKVGHNRNKSTRYEIFRQEIQENTKTMDAFYNLNCTSGGDARCAIIAIQHLEQSGKTLFQATTQMTCTMCENVTSKEKIFQMFCEYKLFNKKKRSCKEEGRMVPVPTTKIAPPAKLQMRTSKTKKKVGKGVHP